MTGGDSGEGSSGFCCASGPVLVCGSGAEGRWGPGNTRLWRNSQVLACARFRGHRQESGCFDNRTSSPPPPPPPPVLLFSRCCTAARAPAVVVNCITDKEKGGALVERLCPSLGLQAVKGGSVLELVGTHDPGPQIPVSAEHQGACCEARNHKVTVVFPVAW